MPRTRQSCQPSKVDEAAGRCARKGDKTLIQSRTESQRVVTSGSRKSLALKARQKKEAEILSVGLDEVDGPVHNKCSKSDESQVENVSNSKKKTAIRNQRVVKSKSDPKDEKRNSLRQDLEVEAKSRCMSATKSVPARKRKSEGSEPVPVIVKRSKENEKVTKTISRSESKTKVSTLASKALKGSNEQRQNISDSQRIRRQTVRSKEQTIKPSNQSGSAEREKRLKNKKQTVVETSDIPKSANTTIDSFTIKTEENSSSDSDSDFEEVETPFRTPERRFAPSVQSDSGASDMDRSHSQSSSFTASSSSVTSYGSSLSSQNKSSSFISSSVSSFSSCSDTAAVYSKNSSVSSIGGSTSTSKQQSKGKAKTSASASKTKDDKKEKQGVSKVKKTLVSKEKLGKSMKSVQCTAPVKKDEMTAGQDDIMALLMQMEGGAGTQHTAVKQNPNQPSTSGSSSAKKAEKKQGRRRTKPQSDSSEESDWEEVEDYKHSPTKSQVPDGPVQITIDDPGMMIRKKKKKKEFDWEAYALRKIKRLAKQTQVDMHKVNLLCLLAHGMQQNTICNDATLQALCLSVVPPAHLRVRPLLFDTNSLKVLIKWFRAKFSLGSSPTDVNTTMVKASQLAAVVQSSVAVEPRLLVMVLVVLLRSMGLNSRLVMSLQPVPMKTSTASTGKTSAKHKKNDKSEGRKSASQSSRKAEGSKVQNTKSSNSKNSASSSSSKQSKNCEVSEKSDRKWKPVCRKRSKQDEEKTSSSEDDSSDDDLAPSHPKRRSSVRPKKNSKPSPALKAEDLGDDDGDDFLSCNSSDGSNFSEEDIVVSKKSKAKAKAKRKTKVPSKQSKQVSSESDGSDDEFDHSFNARSVVVKEGKKPKKASRKILSSESSPESNTSSRVKPGRDYWLEVYLPAEFNWLCVDIVRQVVGKRFDISAAASQPMLYVLGFENDGSVKDITAKYAPQWLSHTRKQRVDSDWWREALEPYATTNEMMDYQENESIKEHLIKRPIPTSIGDFKNHPLYALRRHLLKYEAIYPESSVPLGYIRQEPVYARECVHTLHSRENWLKEARVVRLGETAYKVVKSRKRKNRCWDSAEDYDLDLFGRWQTEEYIPPPAVDGKVPKNEYGNVELFQPSMLPGGTVHIRVPALNRTAKKLGIDIAAAMTGWDYHGGYSHPVMDGWIVCEEHKEVLLAAWEEDQEIQRQREEERREKRVLGNWTTLVRGLMIKEKLKKKFNLEEKVMEEKKKQVKAAKTGKKATDVQHAWPAKQQQDEKSRKKPVPAPSHYTVETM